MSYALGTKVKLKMPWRTYSKGDVLEQGYMVDLESLVKGGIAEKVGNEIEPARPAKMTRKAADKVASVARSARDLLN